ncbi:hypothetical protein F4820DRAFT_404812 [Hypoxylon rubiginosum]|uniref:Uncharacterized protein n=1 Tax=Hypoxylon rubiginosum TaxID=110542 RepID=A0ACB9ZGC3_9PEZI|nr:hypothetical protein F4820DRAFT_404812 [Hypoxylon rubiginosum]
MDKIPNEIYFLILHTFDRKRDKSTILSLRSVNKRWDSIAKPYVYTTFRLHEQWRAQDYTDRLLDITSTQYLVYLCARLSKPRSCPSFVKSLEVPDMEKGWVTRPRKKIGAIRSHSRLLSKVKPELSLSFREELVAEAFYRHPKTPYWPCADSLLAFVLLVCPKLENLSVSGRYCNSRIKEVFDMATKPWIESIPEKQGKILGCMETFQLGDTSIWWVGPHLNDVIEILSLPKLKNFHLIRPYDGNRCYEGSRITKTTFPSPDPRLCHLEPIHLTLTACKLSENGLERILAACRKPRSLFIRSHELPIFTRLTKVIANGNGLGKGLEFLLVHSLKITPVKMADLVATLRILDGSLHSLVITSCDIPDMDALAAALPRSLRQLLILRVGLKGTPTCWPLIRRLGSTATPNLEQVSLVNDKLNISSLICDRCNVSRSIPSTKVLKKLGCRVFVKRHGRQFGF